MNIIKPVVIIILALGVLAAGCAPSQMAAPTPGATARVQQPEKAAWEQKWDLTLAAAKQEGKAVIYGEIGPTMRTKMPQAFKEKYGIELEFVTGPAAEVAQKYLSEVNAGVYLADVLFSGGGTFTRVFKPRGIVAPLEPFFILPDVKNPKLWPEIGIPYLDKERMVVMSTMGRMPFTLVNTELVKEGEITSYKDILNPKWKSKIVIFDPTMTGGGSTWVAFLLDKIYGLEDGKKYMQQIAALDPAIIRDKRLPVEWTAKGKYAIHIGPNLQSVSEFKQAGAPISEIREKEGSLVHPSSSCFAIVTKPAHPNAAAILVNWLLSAEAGTILSQSFGYPASRRDVSVAGLDPLGVPQPNEKIFLSDEEFVKFQVGPAIEAAKEIFGPIMK